MNLKDFYLDKSIRSEVQDYLINFLKEEALRKLFDKEDVSAVAEAKEMIDKAFENLDVMFMSRADAKEVKNEAR